MPVVELTILNRTRLLTPGSKWRHRGTSSKTIATVVRVDGVLVTYRVNGKIKRSEAREFLYGHKLVGEAANKPIE